VNSILRLDASNPTSKLALREAREGVLAACQPPQAGASIEIRQVKDMDVAAILIDARGGPHQCRNAQSADRHGIDPRGRYLEHSIRSPASLPTMSQKNDGAFAGRITDPAYLFASYLNTTGSLDDIRSLAALGSLQDAPRFRQPNEPGRVKAKTLDYDF
jgi:hypothetical protein